MGSIMWTFGFLCRRNMASVNEIDRAEERGGDEAYRWLNYLVGDLIFFRQKSKTSLPFLTALVNFPPPPTYARRI